ncbi:hydroxymethylglutaryl-CoA lyase [Thermocrispum municipale]|uniref:hydroxymethylglutaryl-CoA lyase n=1 Tax=Thermocrispum municipale TaxID=37926 RepID=UPI00040F12E6|nr:hydroxymethylglutaryl-CoA lyase [Thermocrispum municipale]
MSVELVEVGPRDGLQNEARTLDIDTRAELIRRLVDLGLRRLEAVSFVRPDRVPQMAGAEEVLAQLPVRDDVTYIGLVLNARGAERAAATACSEINIVVPVTDEFCARNQNTTVDGMLQHAASASAVGRDAGMSVSVTLAVAFGCPFAGDVPLSRVRDVYDRVADLGIDEIAFADTIGVGVPGQVSRMAELVRRDSRVPRIRFHFHNTRNTGYANAAVASSLDGLGTIALDASIGGFGGCPFAPAATGNIATEDLTYLLQRDGVDIGTRLEIPAMTRVATWLADELDSPVQGLLARAGDFPGGSLR